MFTSMKKIKIHKVANALLTRVRKEQRKAMEEHNNLPEEHPRKHMMISWKTYRLHEFLPVATEIVEKHPGLTTKQYLDLIDLEREMGI